MTVLNPILLWTGLGCIVIPILIHILMRRRRRPVQWGAMKFLLEAYRRQRRRMNLEQLLLLASRCLLVAILALALGKPVLGSAGLLGTQSARTLVILLDNSLTSSASEPGGQSGLDRSRGLAMELLDELDASRGDRVAVIALAGPAEPLVVPASGDFGAVRGVLAEIRATESRADFASGAARAGEELQRLFREDSSARATVAVLSEFRTGAADTGSTLASLGVPAERFTLVAPSPSDATRENVSITAVEPLRLVMLPGAQSTVSAQFRVTLQRSGALVGAASSSRITVRVGPPGSDSPSRGDAVAVWTPGATTVSTVVGVEIGAAKAAGRLIAIAGIDRDSIPADNTFRRPIEARERLDVGLIAPGPIGAQSTIDRYTPGDWLALALSPDAELGVRRRQQGELRLNLFDPARPAAAATTGAALAEMNVVLIPRPDLLDRTTWSSIRKIAEQGGVAVVFAPPGIDTHLWADACAESLGLPWKISRTHRDIAGGARINPVRPASTSRDLLDALAGELPDLAEPVTLSRILPIEAAPGSFEPVLSLEDGTPLAISGDVGGRGLVVFFAAAMDLSWTNLPTKPLMVPLIQEVSREGLARAAGLGSAIAGVTPVLPPGAGELVRQPIGPDEPGPGAARVVDGRLSPAIRESGVFAARGPGGSVLSLLCFNADPAAGLVDPRSSDEVGRWLSGLGTDITWITPESAAPGRDTGDGRQAPPISVPLFALALALAAAEAILARFFSHAKREDAVVGVRPQEVSKAA